MNKARKTHGRVRDIFKRDFADPEFVMLFQEERARSELAHAVAKARQAVGLTQAELAEKVGILQNIVSAHERGRLRLSAEMLIRFARALDVSTDDLLGIQEKPSNGTTKNRRLLRRISHIDKLSKRDQEALLRTIDAFLAKEP